MAMERRVLLANGQYITIVQTTGTSTEDVMSQNAVTTELNAKLSKTDAISFIKTVETATQLSAAPTSATTQHTVTANGASKTVDYVIGEMVRVPSSNSDTGYEFYQLHNKTAQSGAVWSVVGGGGDFPFETVVVSVTREDGTPVTGVTVYIAGIPRTVDSNGKATWKVLIGSGYTVECTDVIPSFNIPSPQTFTAQAPQRNVSMVYKPFKNGVFIEATNYELYLSNDWPSSKTPNSIVVLTDSVKFRIALTHSYLGFSDSRYTPLENYMTGTTSSSNALADYDGAGNTANILKAIPSTGYAAGYCNAFVFPDGKTKGYLPSLGQLNLAYQNMAAVDAALSKCGGTAMTDRYYWSSTFWGNNQYDSWRYVWRLYWGNGDVESDSILSELDTRPFAAYQ